MSYAFIFERSNKQKLEVFLVTLMVVVVLAALVTAFLTFFREGFLQSPSFHGMKAFFEKDIKAISPLGLFYMSFFGNLLFVPLPIEFPFYFGLLKGNPFFTSLFLVTAGLIPSYALDYFIGFKLSRIIFTFISTKKIYKVKRWVDRYGSYAIFGFNLLPLPANELTFALGIAKYNITRLFVVTIVASILKFFAIWGFALVF